MKWYKVKDKLPDRKTKYAATYGVSVIYYDENEYIDSDYFEPSTCIFHFVDQKFKALAFTPNGAAIYMEIRVTHWAELPDIPEREKEDGTQNSINRIL